MRYTTATAKLLYVVLLLPYIVRGEANSNAIGQRVAAGAGSGSEANGFDGAESGWQVVDDHKQHSFRGQQGIGEDRSRRTVVYERIRTTQSPVSPSSRQTKRDPQLPLSPSSPASDEAANVFETIAKVKPVLTFILRHPLRFLMLALPWTFYRLYSVITFLSYCAFVILRFTSLDVLLPILSILSYPIAILSSPIRLLYSIIVAFSPLGPFFATAIATGILLGSVAALATGFLGSLLSKSSADAKIKDRTSGWTARLEKMTSNVTPSPSMLDVSEEGSKGKGRAARREGSIGKEELVRRKSIFEPHLPRSRSAFNIDEHETTSMTFSSSVPSFTSARDGFGGVGGGGGSRSDSLGDLYSSSIRRRSAGIGSSRGGVY